MQGIELLARQDILFAVAIVAYLVFLLAAAYRLKALNDEEWRSLGSPSLLNWSVRSSFKLGRYVFFTNRYASLRDVILTILVWSARVAMVVWVLIFFARIAVTFFL